MMREGGLLSRDSGALSRGDPCGWPLPPCIPYPSLTLMTELEGTKNLSTNIYRSTPCPCSHPMSL